MLTIPPVETPISATLGTFTIRFALYASATAGGYAHVDWVMLLPIDQGMSYVNKTSAADVVMIDSHSTPQAAYLLNTSNVLQSIPANQVGSPPEAHPQGARLYFVGSGAGTGSIANGWTVAVTYISRYLHVA